jgi:hypothetical protein
MTTPKILNLSSKNIEAVQEERTRYVIVQAAQTNRPSKIVERLMSRLRALRILEFEMRIHGIPSKIVIVPANLFAHVSGFVSRIWLGNGYL